jgi:predicted DNA-binding protein with PD1-like motif
MQATTIVLVALSFVATLVSFSSTSVLARDASTPLKKQSNAPKVTEQKRVAMVVNKHRSIVERLKPGVDFQGELKRIAAEHNLKAGVIVSAVGSFKTASLRFAGANEATTITGPLEVVSVTGTISEKGMHVHLSVSDANGKTIGGHLMPGCKVFTTIELVIVDLSDDWSFERKTDEHTTYLELDPQPIDAK